jgi:hypothetical protein
VTLSLRRIVVEELRRLGATSVRINERGGHRHPKVIARFGDRELEMSAPRGDRKDRAHLRRNYEAETRRRVRKFLAAGSA